MSDMPTTKQPPGPLSTRHHVDQNQSQNPNHHTRTTNSSDNSNTIHPANPQQPANTLLHTRHPSTATPHSRSPSAAGLSLQTDFTANHKILPSNATPSIVNTFAADVPQAHGSAAMDIQHHQQKGLSSALSAASLGSSLSPSSAISSPALGALADITPLPSPLVGGDSPGPWRRATGPRPDSRGSSGATREDCLSMLSTGTLSPSRTPSRKSKGYSGLMTAAVEAHSANMLAVEKNRSSNHARTRSLSEYHPDPLHNTRPRHVTISNPNAAGKEPAAEDAASQSQLHREEYLAAQRGLAAAPSAAPSTARLLPTPPPSNRSSTESEEEDLKDEDMDTGYFSIKHDSGKRKLYRPLRQLGQGAFSKVILATREKTDSKQAPNESQLNPRKLVAIKVVEHGPAGGADEARVEMTLKREVEVLKSISHPSLIHLKAFDFDDQQALLVLNYCPGGDLYELADKGRDHLKPDLVQRFFAELVGAVRYLHSQCIVHRDIKLENVLLNVPVDSLSSIQSPQTHPTALLTLTDLGLCRRIDLADPLLTTRCGSEDYAAPEILLGQSYDGRSTDAWALGVLLYALMEGRLPFDPPPGKGRARSRTVHRIARCDWMWCVFGDDDGEWDPEKPETVPWAGAREVVEGLLKKVSRGRKSLDEVAEMDWVKMGLQVEGGVLKRADEDSDSERSGIASEALLELGFERPAVHW
ncbi:kinase-like domain-containing protein [Phyllosticta capitalensis]|uniref:Kinase-like domain-containing protein n=1 Tax=Phyllosticta capitalensis TaxID=121624 RepID=A0ABR1YTN6_9PEZI